MAIRSIHGKQIYITKTTDALTTKLNHVSNNIKQIDETFQLWEKHLNKFASREQCEFQSTLEFLSKHSALTSRLFAALMRLNEIQNTLLQLADLSKKTLFRSSDLPEYLASEIFSTIKGDPKLFYTARAFYKGFSVMINPMVEMEHTGKHIIASTLFTIPEIKSLHDFCALEYLSPLKFNLSNVCYTGPVTKKNFVLISCPNSRQLTTVEALGKCYQHSESILCPKHLLQTSTNTSWLGLPLNPNVKLSFNRHHVPASDCINLQPLVHLGGRYFLSTTTAKLKLKSRDLTTSSLVIYHIPCNESFEGMTAGLGTCPKSMSLTVPLFSTDTFQYVPWQAAAPNQPIMQLHYKSLHFLPKVKLNNTIKRELEQTYQTLDGKLTSDLQQANDDINDISETSTTSATTVVAYCAMGLTVLNLLIWAFLIHMFCKFSKCARCHRPNGSCSGPTITRCW